MPGFRAWGKYDELDSEGLGIYCHFSDENMMNVKAMVIGPEETPYEGGFYFFDINLLLIEFT